MGFMVGVFMDVRGIICVCEYVFGLPLRRLCGSHGGEPPFPRSSFV